MLKYPKTKANECSTEDLKETKFEKILPFLQENGIEIKCIRERFQDFNSLRQLRLESSEKPDIHLLTEFFHWAIW